VWCSVGPELRSSHSCLTFQQQHIQAQLWRHQHSAHGDGPLHSALGTRHSALGLWRSAFGLLHLALALGTYTRHTPCSAHSAQHLHPRATVRVHALAPASDLHLRLVVEVAFRARPRTFSPPPPPLVPIIPPPQPLAHHFPNPTDKFTGNSRPTPSLFSPRLLHARMPKIDALRFSAVPKIPPRVPRSLPLNQTSTTIHSNPTTLPVAIHHLSSPACTYF